MSTNYYLDAPDNETGHLGKWGGGYFTAKAPEGINSFDAWFAQLDGHKIFAESGYEVTADEMLKIVEPVRRNRNATHIRRPRSGEWVERGVLFVRHDFC
ncbi:hypothetical protein K1T35_47445 (plasmid) [Pseudonocardia sp. DSM 110487]|uniref:hypothetical protein n=1 Tax=Pseudonocardia sp. DSM 110487 TaxID=2865833 RepID=UPI001C699BBD|nr:hypothetical protein [Pseudonocardia sp. DSM 110487]QYN40985.1 hypothetical protein K1T35_47445 [Pseudonocardia sp. DSM 110487]